MKNYNNNKMPSINQVDTGLIAEAIVQLELSMGGMKDSEAKLASKTNIKETWELLLSEL